MIDIYSLFPVIIIILIIALTLILVYKKEDFVTETCPFNSAMLSYDNSKYVLIITDGSNKTSQK